MELLNNGIEHALLDFLKCWFSILGEELESSRELLRELTVAACQSPRTLKHDWTPGDIVIWDNRCVLHRGHEWPDDAARVMVRSTVAGDAASNEWVVPAATA